jgi:hypothetical protein
LPKLPSLGHLQGESIHELLGMGAESVVVDGNKRPSQDEYKETNERNLVGVALNVKAYSLLAPDSRRTEPSPK